MAAVAPAPDAHVAKNVEPVRLLSPTSTPSKDGQPDLGEPGPSSPTSPALSSSTKEGARRNPRRVVTITFDDDEDGQHDEHHLLHSVTQSFRSNKTGSKTPASSNEDTPYDLDVDFMDIKVAQYPTGCSYFTLKSTGKSTQQMEARLSRAKYKVSHGPFSKVSLLMSCCILITSVARGSKNDEQEWIRFSILMAGVFPLYLFYCWFACARKTAFLNASGTWKEYLLVALVFVQGVGIAIAEWAEDGPGDQTWYGSVVLHLVFIHNFTPLSPGEVQLTSLVCLVVHLVLTYLVHLRREKNTEEYPPGELCRQTRGDAQVLIALFVPCILLLYQNFISIRRDRMMREDLLSSVQERSQRQQMQVETRKCEELLKSMLPRRIIKALKENQPVQPQLFQDCTVIFVEICNFSDLCLQLPAQLCVEILDGVYTELDRVSDLLHVYKVETVNQVYMAVVGCPDVITNHADVAAIFGLAAQHLMPKVRNRIADLPIVKNGQKAEQQDSPKFLGQKPISTQNFAKRILDDTTLQIRVGINSGPVRAGVVGLACPRYKLIGDTVNTASRMESHCAPGKVQASPSTQERLTEGMFVLEQRGPIEVKGKGAMQLAFVSSYADVTNQDRMEVMIDYGVEQPVENVMVMPNALNEEQPGLHRNHTAGTHASMDTNQATVGSVGLGSMRSVMQHPSDASAHRLDRSFGSTPVVASAHSPPMLLPQDSVSGSETQAKRLDEYQPVNTMTSFHMGEQHHEQTMHGVWSSSQTSLASPQSVATLPLSRTESLMGLQGDSLDVQPSTIKESSPILGTISGKFRDTLVRPIPTWAVQRTDVRGVLSLRLPFVNGALKKDHFFAGENYGSEESDNPSGIANRVASIGMNRWIRVNRWFLFTSDKLKSPQLMRRLWADRPVYLEDTLWTRIAFARNVTQIWLILINTVSLIDFFMDVMTEDVERYRTAIMFRAVGNNIAGLLYLLSITREAIFREHGELLTFLLLLAQGLSLHAKATVIYNNEPGIVALYGAYVLSYTVLRIYLRLPIIILAMVGYATVEMIRCEPDRLVKVLNNLGFLFVFFLFLACGVRLEEHLEHVAHMEKRAVKAQMQAIEQAKKAGDELLTNMLPRHVVHKMNNGEWPTAEIYPDVTVIFTDIKNFTPYCASINVNQLVEFLNTLFSAFDDVLDLWGLYKVEVIGDAYFVSSGCPLPINPKDQLWPHEYAMRAVEVALALQRTLPNVCDDPNVRMRVGVHSGEVLAGVVGKKGPRYHLFGQTVSRAEKMESTGMPNRVQISEETHALLVKGGHAYDYEKRDDAVVDPVKGPLKTFWVTRNTDGKTNSYKRGLLQQRRMSKGRVTAPPVVGS